MNPFYVQPGNDFSQGLTGLGDVLGRIGEQKRLREEEDAAKAAYEQSIIDADAAIQSGDLDLIRSTALKNPHLSESIYKGYGVTSERDKQDVVELNRTILASGDPVTAIQKKISALDALGKDSTQWQEELIEAQQDPNAYLSMTNMAFAGMAPKEYDALVKSKEKPAASTDIGKAKADLDAGLITQEQFNQIVAPNMDTKYQSEVGKLIGDKQAIENEFGTDSPQAQAINEVIQSKQKGDSAPSIAETSGMRKEFTALSGPFITMRDAFKKVNSAGEDAAGDLSLIFSFMKILDPGSVVREQEFANAQNSAGVPEQIRNQYNKILSGERLSPEQRQRFKSEASNLFSSQSQSQAAQEKIFRQIAERQGFNPDDVVVDFMGELRDYDPNSADAGWTDL